MLLGIGLSFGVTRYGVFGMTASSSPPSVAAGSPEAAEVEDARKALLQDTFSGYKQARRLTAKVLATKEYPEVRALWCQAVFYLQRRYAAADPKDISRCQEQPRRPWSCSARRTWRYIKSFAGYALARRRRTRRCPACKDA